MRRVLFAAVVTVGLYGLAAAGLCGEAGASADAAAPATGASAARTEPDSTSIPVRPGTTIYVRYGEPGGVHIVRGAAAATDSADSVTVSTDARAAWLERFRLLLRDELARSLAERRGEPVAAPGVSPLEGGAPPVVVVTSESKEPRPSATGVPDSLRAAADTSATREIPAEGWVPVSERRDDEGAAGEAPVGSPEAGVAPEVEPAPESPVVPVAPVAPPAQPAPITREAVRAAILDAGLIESNLILFATGSEDLLPPSRAFLDAVASVLAEYPATRIRVEGYTDDVGRAETNLALSRRRAEAVRAYLVGPAGVPADRVEAEGYGEASPVVPNDSAAHRALNRRVVVRVLNPDALAR